MFVPNYKINITKKAVIFLCLGCILPILLFGVFTINKIDTVLEEEVQSQAMNLLGKKQSNLELVMQNIESMMINLSNLDEIRNTLMDQTTDSSYNKLAAQARMGYILSGYSNLKGLVSIDIFSMNNSHYHIGDTLNYQNINEDQKKMIFSESLAASGAVKWHGVEGNVNKNSSYKKVIVASKIIQIVDSATMKEKPIGLLVVNYDIDVFTKDIDDSVFQNSTDMVFDTEGRILYYTDKNMIGRQLEPAFLAMLSQNMGSFTSDINGEPTLVIYLRSKMSRWVMVSLIPVSAIKEKTSSVNQSMAFLIAFCFMMILIFTLFISRKYLSPVRRITELFKDLQNGKNDLNISINKESDDEIGELVVWFNAFLKSLKEKKIAEDNLFKSREQYRSVVENVKEVIFQTDAEGKLTFLNPAWTEVTGISLEEGVGKNFLDYVCPEDQPLQLAIFKALLQRKKEFCRHIVRYVTRKGDVRWVEVFARLTTDGAGNIIGTSGTLMDITDRINMEQELINRERLLKATADATNILLGIPDHRDAFYQALGIMGEAINVDRVYIFENSFDPETSVMTASQSYEWCRDGIKKQINNPDLQNISCQDARSMRWYDALSANTVISGLVCDFPESEQEILKPQGILSLLVVPIYIDNRFLGFIGFDDCTHERKWTKVEENTLKVAAASIGGALKRIQAESALQEVLRNDFTRTVKNLQNLVFKLKKNSQGESVFTLFEGRMASEFGLNTNDVFEKTPDEIFGRESAAVFHQFKDLFSEDIKNFELTVSDRILFVTLSPIMENGVVIEVVGSATNISEHRKAEEKILHMAYYDSLTDLPNRVLFGERLIPAILQADAANSLIAVMFLDLDQFKLVNDTLGHAFGDSLLQETAARLKNQICGADIISRTGGDEFALMFSRNGDISDVIRNAEDVLEVFKEPFSINQYELYISASVGISLYPDDGQDIQTLLMSADSAMYRAKEGGRNGYQFFSSELNTQAMNRLNLVNNLRKAVDQKEFLLQYQPKFDTKTGKITGCEALIRWRHPEMGLIEPGSFIHIAEETSLIIPIGEWVLRTACCQCKKWVDAGYPDMNISVNISARQIQYQNIVELVSQVLRESGLNPENLELEITENVIVRNTEKTLATIKDLKSLGLKISIDDFGTGYSSMAYLKRFTVDKLKIDRSFINDIYSSRSDVAIISAIIHLAHKLNLTVVAEGVETSEQLAILKSLHCDEIQGFLYSKPLDEEDFIRLLGKSHHVAGS